MDAFSTPPAPTNEPNQHYAPDSRERAEVEAELAHLAAEPMELTELMERHDAQDRAR